MKRNCSNTEKVIQRGYILQETLSLKSFVWLDIKFCVQSGHSEMMVIKTKQ